MNKYNAFYDSLSYDDPFFSGELSLSIKEGFLSDHSVMQAESIDRLKVLLLAHLNHAVRTPLTSILGFSELLLRQNLVDEKIREEYYGYIVRNCDQLLSSFEHVQELCEIDSGLRQPDNGVVDLGVLCFEALFQYRSLVASGVVLEVNSGCVPFRVFSDAYLLKRLCVHLLDNAVRCTKKGHILLSYYYLHENSLLYICISDTGCGISPQDHERIFSSFEKTDTYSPGFGLGLTICRSIAEHMGGRIRVESELSQGTLFIVSIPCDRVV